MKLGYSLLLALLICGLSTNELSSQASSRAYNEQYFADYANILKISISRKLNNARYISVSGGTVTLSFTIERSGRVINSSLLQSSGDPHIDRAAMEVFSKGAQFPPFPEKMNMSSLKISFPVRLPPH